MSFSFETFTNSKRLPSIPRVGLEIVKLAQQDEPDYDGLSRLVSADPALSGKILMTVNSILFGQSRTVHSVSEAIPRLGTNLLRTVVLSFYLAQHRSHGSQFDRVLARYWRNSLAQGVFAEIIAENVDEADPATYFLAGLVQDIGLLAILMESPWEYIDEIHDSLLFPDVETERTFFGFSHNEVSASIIENWGLDDFLTDAVRQHHNRFRVSNLANVLHAAHLGAETFNLFTNRNFQESPFHEFVSSQFGKTTSEINQIIVDVNQRVGEYAALFSFPLDEHLRAEAIVAQARELIAEFALESQTELEKASRQAEFIDLQDAIRDPLTGMYNRRYLTTNLDQLVRESVRTEKPMAILFIDADQLKSINDTFGHSEGDRAIRFISKKIQKCIRKNDSLVRLGGDEFVVLFPHVKEKQFAKIASRFPTRFSDFALQDGTRVPLSVSVGVVFYQPKFGDPVDVNWLVDQADRAMYQAKQQGGGTICFAKLDQESLVST